MLKLIMPAKEVAFYENLMDSLEAADSFTSVNRESATIFFHRFAKLYQQLKPEGIGICLKNFQNSKFSIHRETPLTHVAKTGNLALMKWMLEQEKNDVIVSNQDNQLPLELAVFRCDWEMIDVILKAGSHVTFNSLHHAILHDNVPLLSKLLARTGGLPHTCFMLALCATALRKQNMRELAELHKFGCSRLLILLVGRHEYIFDQPTGYQKQLSDECRCLTRLSSEEIKNLIEFLLCNLEIDPNELEVGGKSVLWYARNQYEAEILLKYGADPTFTRDGISLLGQRARRKNLRMVEFWIGQGLSVENVKMDDDDNSILMYTMLQDSEKGFKMARLLLDNNHSSILNHTNKYNQTALMLAIKSSNYGLAEFLCNNGANVNFVDNDGNCALFLAVQSAYYNEHMVNLLLQKNANVNVCGKEKKKTAFMYIVESQSLQMTKKFLDAGADIGARDSKKKSVLAYAAKGAKKDLIRKLLEEKDLTKKAEEAAAYARELAQKAEEATTKARQAIEKIGSQPPMRKKRKKN